MKNNVTSFVQLNKLTEALARAAGKASPHHPPKSGWQPYVCYLLDELDAYLSYEVTCGATGALVKFDVELREHPTLDIELWPPNSAKEWTMRLDEMGDIPIYHEHAEPVELIRILLERYLPKAVASSGPPVDTETLIGRLL